MNKLFAILVLAFAFLFTAQAVPACKHARILGATWGLSDVTAHVAHQYNLGNTVFTANEATFGDSHHAGTNTLSVVYEQCGNIATLVVKEGETVTIPQGHSSA
eukprot:CAMPEP_0202957888 /NCGR_PEP_ID=MMETSP1396-20130829/2266_1 /ASSEMBLY_ACC=CAM_ASM_000872 /TAXON_ID= /ORGANISM="Pseudokeronopsis sp., Strain Brazil" /LENGTH=102 /DNA_ID=CAMNT_0049675617 /DNA_START=28 /DNA_END=336 /DNA_ORIENTATION=+